MGDVKSIEETVYKATDQFGVAKKTDLLASANGGAYWNTHILSDFNPAGNLMSYRTYYQQERKSSETPAVLTIGQAS